MSIHKYTETLKKLAARLESEADALPGDRALIREIGQLAADMDDSLTLLRTLIELTALQDRAYDVTVQSIGLARSVQHVIEHHVVSGPCYEDLRDALGDLIRSIGLAHMTKLLHKPPYVGN